MRPTSSRKGPVVQVQDLDRLLLLNAVYFTTGPHEGYNIASVFSIFHENHLIRLVSWAAVTPRNIALSTMHN